MPEAVRPAPAAPAAASAPAAAAPRLTGPAWAMLVALSVLWGGSFLTAKIAVTEIPPLTVVLLRVAIAGAVVHLVLLAGGKRLPLSRDLVVAWVVMGFLNNALPFTLIFTGQQAIGAGLASILNATTPIFTVIAAHVFTADEKATANKAVGVVLGFLGVAVLVGVDLLAGLAEHIGAELLCLGGAAAYAVSSIWARRFRGRPPMETAAGQLTAATLMMLPVAFVVDGPAAAAQGGPAAWAAILSLAVLSTALAYVLFFRILVIAGATNLMLVTLLVPASAILMSALVLGERLGAKEALGLALIVASLAAIDGRPFHWARRRLAGGRPGLQDKADHRGK